MIDEHFGTVAESMFTLFQVMTTEGWVAISREAARFEPWSKVFFIVYLIGTTFAIMNVVVAVIVEKTLERALQNRDDRLKKAEDQCQKALNTIVEVFKMA